MTRSLSAEANTALQLGRSMARDFLWLIARNRETGDPVEFGAWSDVGTYTAPIIDPYTGNVVVRSFHPAGASIEIPDIPLVQGLAVQSIEIKLNQVSDDVNDFLRTYDCKQAIIQVHRGMYDLDTHELVAAAFPRFNGFVSEAPIRTPAENTYGDARLIAIPNSQELRRSNADTRSGVSQALRAPTGGADPFYDDTAVVNDWPIFWGRNSS